MRREKRDMLCYFLLNYIRYCKWEEQQHWIEFEFYYFLIVLSISEISEKSLLGTSSFSVFDFVNFMQCFSNFQLDSTQAMVKFLERPIKFVLSSEHVQYDHNVSVTWAIPDDQATHMDWIGK